MAIELTTGVTRGTFVRRARGRQTIGQVERMCTGRDGKRRASVRWFATYDWLGYGPTRDRHSLVLLTALVPSEPTERDQQAMARSKAWQALRDGTLEPYC